MSDMSDLVRAASILSQAGSDAVFWLVLWKFFDTACGLGVCIGLGFLVRWVVREAITHNRSTYSE